MYTKLTKPKYSLLIVNENVNDFEYAPKVYKNCFLANNTKGWIMIISGCIGGNQWLITLQYILSTQVSKCDQQWVTDDEVDMFNTTFNKTKII